MRIDAGAAADAASCAARAGAGVWPISGLRLIHSHQHSQASPANPVNQNAPRHPYRTAMGVMRMGVITAPSDPPL